MVNQTFDQALRLHDTHCSSHYEGQAAGLYSELDLGLPAQQQRQLTLIGLLLVAHAGSQRGENFPLNGQHQCLRQRRGHGRGRRSRPSGPSLLCGFHHTYLVSSAGKEVQACGNVAASVPHLVTLKLACRWAYLFVLGHIRDFCQRLFMPRGAAAKVDYSHP